MNWEEFLTDLMMNSPQDAMAMIAILQRTGAIGTLPPGAMLGVQLGTAFLSRVPALIAAMRAAGVTDAAALDWDALLPRTRAELEADVDQNG